MAYLINIRQTTRLRTLVKKTTSMNFNFDKNYFLRPSSKLLDEREFIQVTWNR